MFHDLSRLDPVTWDATGKVAETRFTENHLYYYEITVRNLTTGKISLPVAIMIPSDQSQPTVEHWMTCFCNDEKRIYGANKLSQPLQINSDRAMVFVTTVMEVFNLLILEDSAW